MPPYWAKYHRLKVQPYFVREDMNAYFDSLYAQTAFRDTAEINTYMATDCFEAFSEDSVISHWLQFDRLIDEVYRPALDRYERKVAELNQIYVRGLCEMYGWTKAPDANSTLRMTYGSVRGYSPRDAVQYGWRTGLKGMFEKENPADPDYVVERKNSVSTISPRTTAPMPTPTASCPPASSPTTTSPAAIRAALSSMRAANSSVWPSTATSKAFRPTSATIRSCSVASTPTFVTSFSSLTPTAVSHYLLNEMEIRR